METDTYNLVSVIISIVTLLITIIGIVAIFIQIKKVNESLYSTTHSTLCSQSIEIIQHLSLNTETYDFFYENKELKDNYPKKVEILYSAEIIANFMEQIILQKTNMPSDQWVVWNRFIYSSMEKSITLKKFITENKSWYSKELVAMAERV